MTLRNGTIFAEVPALLIAPDRELAQQFRRSLEVSRAFQIVLDFKKYPSEPTLELRLKQLKPSAVLLDLVTDRGLAERLIHFIAIAAPAIRIIGLDWKNDPEAVLRALKLGAGEFLCAPFDPDLQREAAQAVLRLVGRHQQEHDAPQGRILAFTSAKAGAGASTLAWQTAQYLGKNASVRTLLVDLDLLAGTVSHYVSATRAHSFLDAVERTGYLDAAVWITMAVRAGPIFILPAPETAYDGPLDQDRCREVFDSLRFLYDWVIVDLPLIFHKLSLQSIAEADRVFLVATPELPCLHLARRAITLLAQFGVGDSRLEVIVNKMNKGAGMTQSDLAKILNAPITQCIPSDEAAVRSALARCGPLDEDRLLGRAVHEFARRLVGLSSSERGSNGATFEARALPA
jgi:pilus assembly protein CpaE